MLRRGIQHAPHKPSPSSSLGDVTEPVARLPHVAARSTDCSVPSKLAESNLPLAKSMQGMFCSCSRATFGLSFPPLPPPNTCQDRRPNPGYPRWPSAPSSGCKFGSTNQALTQWSFADTAKMPAAPPPCRWESSCDGSLRGHLPVASSWAVRAIPHEDVPRASAPSAMFRNEAATRRSPSTPPVGTTFTPPAASTTTATGRPAMVPHLSRFAWAPSANVAKAPLSSPRESRSTSATGSR
mmetsp:Transcript_31118/g.88886  ORF Transcript_31118/g.88886 Transcript_31118/m.88886 type:complete len:239 (-) Transcript_31118:455-1171(-)